MKARRFEIIALSGVQISILAYTKNTGNKLICGSITCSSCSMRVGRMCCLFDRKLIGDINFRLADKNISEVLKR